MLKFVVLRNEAISDKFYPGNNWSMYLSHSSFFRIFASCRMSTLNVVNFAVLTRSMYTLWKHQIKYTEGEYLCVCVEEKTKPSERF